MGINTLANKKTTLLKQREKYLADKVEVQAKIIRGDFMTCRLLTCVFSKIYAVYRRQVLEIDNNASGIIAAILRIPAKEHEIRKIINELSYEMIKRIKEDLTLFILDG